MIRKPTTTAPPPADVPGWSQGLEELYAATVARLPDGAAWVEVGVWLGKSLIYAAREAKRLGRRIRFVGVDHFRGSEEHRDLEVVRRGRLYEECRTHLERYEVNDIVTLVRGESVETAGAFRDDSLDFVFLDASHRYAAVRADIEAWLPKVKPGGVLAGHDWHGWPEVQLAVTGLLDGVTVVGDCWAYRKEKSLATEFLDAMGTFSAPARPACEHLVKLVPADIRAVAAAIDEKEKERWEYVDHFDVLLPADEVPPDLRGNSPGSNGRQQSGAVIISPTQTTPAWFLIFKRPKVEEPAEAKSE